MTGSDDGFLRLWPLDFKHVYLEAEHEGPVTAVDISSDGIKILAGTSSVRCVLFFLSIKFRLTLASGQLYWFRLTGKCWDP